MTTLFDIVNGFLKSMPRGIGFERSERPQGCLAADQGRFTRKKGIRRGYTLMDAAQFG